MDHAEIVDLSLESTGFPIYVPQDTRVCVGDDYYATASDVLGTGFKRQRVFRLKMTQLKRAFSYIVVNSTL